MSNPGPWGGLPPPPPPERRAPDPEPGPGVSWRRIVVWLAVVVGGVAGLALLFQASPWALRTPHQWVYVVMWGLFLLAMSTGILGATRREALRGAGFVAIWGGVVAVLGLGYLYRDELAEAPQRVRMALVPGAAVATAEREITLTRDEDGAFLMVGQVNGQRVLFLVDTGATDTVLSPDDARRVGIDVDSLAFDQTAETANGLGYGAKWTADRLDVGPIRRDRFAMVVNKAPMSVSLLGMSFLGGLESFEIRGRTLVLRWKE